MTKYAENETETLEFKLIFYPDVICREIVSFLNARGGEIVLGVANDGTIIGLNNVDEIMLKIANIVTSQIEPNPQETISSELRYVEGKAILVLHVLKGNSPIYCLKQYGYSSAGCPIRIGTTCRAMTPEQIKSRYELCFMEKKAESSILKKIKENQEEIKELVKNRNELDAEKTGTLSVEECVVIIGLIEKKYVEMKRSDCESVGIPPETVKMKTEGTIRRNIEFWDQYQNGNKAKGRKPPRKDYSRNMDKVAFGKWYNEIMLNKYNKWRAANHIDTLSGRPVKRFGDKYK